MRSNRLYIRWVVCFAREHLFLLVVKISLRKNKPTGLRLLGQHGLVPEEPLVPKSSIETLERVNQRFPVR